MKLFKQTVIAMSCTFFITGVHSAIQKNYEFQPYADVMLGIFHSNKSYTNENDKHEAKAWQEVVAKYGFKAAMNFNQHSLYGSAIAISSATFGDGDAGNVTNGHERRTNLGEWSLGFKDTPSLQEYKHYDISIGRQNIIVADGFMVSGDAVNLGKAVADGSLDRGGAYYLAPRKAFDFTAALKYRPFEKLNTGLYYLKSDNNAQFETEMLVTDALYESGGFGFGGTYLEVLNVEDKDQITSRKDLKNYAMRGYYDLNPNMQLKGEVVYQENSYSTENAGYISLNYNFSDSAYSPSLGYRFSQYSELYDPMFYGNTVGIGGWVQGEVAGNYAGPNNSNAQIHQLSFFLSPKENIMLGTFAYKFQSIEKSEQDLSGYELDIFSVWSPNKRINVIPLIGLYKPKRSIKMGGSQFADRDLNLYTQLLLQYTY